MASRLTALAVDCANPELLTGFWCAALDWVVVDRQPDGWRIEAAGDNRLGIDFFVVPEPKRGPNRLRLNVTATGGDAGRELARLIHLGATVIGTDPTSSGRGLVLADPEGNEFGLA